MKNRKYLIFVFMILLSVFIMPEMGQCAAEKAPMVTVGSMSLNSDDIINYIVTQAGGNDMMAAMLLQQSSLKDRRELVGRLADAMFFAEAAKANNMSSRPDIAFEIKWQTIQILLKAYLQDISTKWDMSEKAMKKYYSGHLSEFVQAPAYKTRQILCKTKNDALNAALEVMKVKDFAKVAAEKSIEKDSAKKGGEIGWIEKGTLPASIDKVLDEASIGAITGPVETGSDTWALFEVTEKRPSKQLTYDESSQEVLQRMQRVYVGEELKKLKNKYKMQIDEKGLSNLAGIPASTK